MLILDSGGVSRLARRDRETAALIIALRRRGLWPPIILTAVLIESLTGSAGRDANAKRLLKSCDVRHTIPESLARRAAALRSQARVGSAIDSLVVAFAENGGCVITSDRADLSALAAHALDVVIEVV